MNISCRDNRFPELLAQFNDPPVEVEQILLCADLGIPFLHPGRFKEEPVVVPGLDLQIIVKIGDPCYRLVSPLL